MLIQAPINVKDQASKRLTRSRCNSTMKKRRAMYFPRNTQLQNLEEQLLCYTQEHELFESTRENDRVIFSGATGSGKTARIHWFLVEEYLGGGMRDIILLTPCWRVASVFYAQRVSAALVEKTVTKICDIKCVMNLLIVPGQNWKFVIDCLLQGEVQWNLLLNAYDWRSSRAYIELKFIGCSVCHWSCIFKVSPSTLTNQNLNPLCQSLMNLNKLGGI